MPGDASSAQAIRQLVAAAIPGTVFVQHKLAANQAGAPCP
jgi:hypothetical protein